MASTRRSSRWRWRHAGRRGRRRARRGCRTRRCGRRRRGSRRISGPRATRDGNLIALEVHALHVGDIVATLHGHGRSLRIARADRGAAEQSRTGSHRGSRRRATRSGADGGPEGGAHQGPDDGPAHRVLRRGLVRGGPRLLESPLTTHGIVALELLEVLPRAREDHDAGTRGHRRACGEQERPHHGQDQDSPDHCALAGTFTHASGHDCTLG